MFINLLSSFSVENTLKLEDALLPLLFNFALHLLGTRYERHPSDLAFADDVKLMVI